MFTLCVALLSTGISRAQSSLVLNAKDGSAENVELAKKPVVTFGAYGDKVTVTYDGQTRTIDLKDLQASGVDAESNELVILKFDNQQPVAFKLSTLLSIVQEDETDQLLPHLIATDPSVSIYRQALEQTGLIDSLSHHVDMTYTVGADSTDWTNNGLVKQFAAVYENVAYMPHRYYKFTALLVKDEVLAAKYGITDIDGLRRKAHEIYDAVYPEDASVSDETDRRNALNRFISYHLLPFLGEYYKLTSIDGEPNTLAKNFLRDQADISDWYETMMPHSIMKFSFPAVAEGLYINRRGIADHADNQGQFVAGTLVPYYSETERHALNGLYTYIDDIVAYDQTMQQVVCNDRMRIDCTTLSPDFMTSGARGHRTRSTVEDGKYASYDYMNHDSQNPSTCLGFKNGSAKNYSYQGSYTSIHVSPRYLNGWNYQGDAVRIMGQYDFTAKLPDVPAGQYELRMGIITNFPSNGVIDIYIDDELKCEQLDIRPQIPYDPEGAPYYYTEERYAVDWDKGKRVTLYTSYGQLVWLTDQKLEEYEQQYCSEQAYAQFVADKTESEGEEYVTEHEAEMRQEFEERAVEYYIELLRGDKSSENRRYNTLYNLWKQAQDDPDQYTFVGDKPLSPDSEEMQAWFRSLVDKEELLQLGYKAYYHKKLHEKGWMPGPASYSPYADASRTFAGINDLPRKIIGTFTTDGQSDHYLRIVQKDRTYPGDYKLDFDYIELIPVDAVATEDKY